MKKILIAGLFILSACGSPNQGSVVRPESLINTSAEKISFPISDGQSVASVADWINTGDAPSGAEVSCRSDSNACRQVKKLLRNLRVSFVENSSVGNGAEQSVSLIYARLTASACFLNQLGCATSLNSVRMVANREQFVKPFISDLQDAETAVRAVAGVK